MVKIKVIDLLNKIANGEEVPKEIIGKVWPEKKEKYIYNGFWYIHTFENPDGEEDYYYMNKDINNLNDEVEIIEEDNKIEHLDIYNCFHIMGDNQISRLRLDDNFQNISDKINEIIDYINKEDNK